MTSTMAAVAAAAAASTNPNAAGVGGTGSASGLNANAAVSNVDGDPNASVAAGSGLDDTYDDTCGDAAVRCNNKHDVPGLVELAAICVASYMPFELVEHVYPPVPEQLQLRIAFWSFPDNEEDIRLYSCLANSSADEFNRGEQLFKSRCVKNPLQIGFHLSASVATQSPRLQFNVAVTFDRRRISSCNCTCSSSAYWCSHVVAVCLHRIHCSQEVCLRAPVSESLTRLQRDQLQKFAQYLISELPQQILPTAQRLLDELLSAQPTAINTVCGAPDPTAGASVHDQTSWYLDEKTLHDNIKRILIKFCLPAPMVLSDVHYLSNNAPPAAAEWSSLLRPLRGREPEGMWNLLSIVREMYRRCDRNAVRLLEIITEECMACDQILMWWFQTKLSLMMGSHAHNGGKHNNANSNSTALQHACSSLCDEIVALWRLAALNPGLAPDERDMLHSQFTTWHLKILDRVVKSRMLPSSYTNKHQQNSRTDAELFVGFKPAMDACFLDWEGYPIAGVTHTHATNPIFYSPFTCFKHPEAKGESNCGQLNVTQGLLENSKLHDYISSCNEHVISHTAFKRPFRERVYSNGAGMSLFGGPGSSNCNAVSTTDGGLPNVIRIKDSSMLVAAGAGGNVQRSVDNCSQNICHSSNIGIGNNASTSAPAMLSKPGSSGGGGGGGGGGNRSSASSEGFCENEDFCPDSSLSHNICTTVTTVAKRVTDKSLTESDSQSSFEAISRRSEQRDDCTGTQVRLAQSSAYRTNTPSTSDSTSSSSASSSSDSSNLSSSPMLLGAADASLLDGTIAVPSAHQSPKLIADQVNRRLSKDESFSSSSDEYANTETVAKVDKKLVASKTASACNLLPKKSYANNLYLNINLFANNGRPVDTGNGLLALSDPRPTTPTTSATPSSSTFISEKQPLFPNGRSSKDTWDTWDILLARAEGLHAHGHGREACILAVRLAEEMLAHPPNLIVELPPVPRKKGKNKNINPLSHQLTVLASSTLSKCAFLCTVLSENPEHYHIAFRICLFALEMPRPPASTKPLEVKLANQEADILAILKKIPLGDAELHVIRERAEQLRQGKLKTRGEALLPINLASFIFDALMMPAGTNGTKDRDQRITAALRTTPTTTTTNSTSLAMTAYKDEELGFEAAVAALGLKANVSEAEHPLLCEGTRRQRGELALTLLNYYKDRQKQVAKIMEKLLDREIHTLLKTPLLPAYYSHNPPVRTPNSTNLCRSGRDCPEMTDYITQISEILIAEFGPACHISRPLSSTSAEVGAEAGIAGALNVSTTTAAPATVGAPMPGLAARPGLTEMGNASASTAQQNAQQSAGVATNRTKDSRYKGKRAYPSIPNQPSEASAHFMFELAKNVLTKAGGNSSTSLFTQATTSQNHHGPHRALHMCAFQLGLYALGLHNCVSPNWLSRTYSSHVSWIIGQAMEIGAPAISFLIDTWEAHLTPPEAASMADRASRGWDNNMIYPAAELALSVLPHAAALNPNEIQRAILQCKEQSDHMLECACFTVENAAKGGGVYPEVLFQVGRYWFELFLRNFPNSELEQHDDHMEHSAFSLSALIESQQQELQQNNTPGLPPQVPVHSIPPPNPTLPNQSNPVASTTLAQSLRKGVAALASMGVPPYTLGFCQGMYHHNLTTYPPNHAPMYMSTPPPPSAPGYPTYPPPPTHPQAIPPPAVQHMAGGGPLPGSLPQYVSLPNPAFHQMQASQITHQAPPSVYQAIGNGTPPFPPPNAQNGSAPLGPPPNIQHPVAVAAASAYYVPHAPAQHQQPTTTPQPTLQAMAALAARQHMRPLQHAHHQHPHQNHQNPHQQPGGQAPLYPYSQPPPPLPPQIAAQQQQQQQQQATQQPPQSVIRQRNPHHQFTPSQLRYLLNAYNAGMLAMETLARRVHDDRPQAKYARNPPYGDDVKWLLRISKKLGTQHLQQFCLSAVNSIVSPFVLHDVAIDSAHYLGRNNHQLVMQNLRSTLTPLVQKCQQMYIQCIHQKLYHLTQADYEEFANIIVAARAAFQITPEGSAQFKDWLQSIKRSKSCKKELWTQINSALSSNSK